MKILITFLSILVAAQVFSGNSFTKLHLAKMDDYGITKDKEEKVIYLNIIQRNRLKVFLKNGRFHYSVNPKVFAKNFGRYVLDPAGNFYFFDHSLPIAKDFEPLGEFFHSSFLSGRPVAGAGWMVLNNEGQVLAISNGSGHYEPSQKIMSQTITLLYKGGVNYPFYLSMFDEDIKDHQYLTYPPQNYELFIPENESFHPFIDPTGFYKIEESTFDTILCCKALKSINPFFLNLKNLKRYLRKNASEKHMKLKGFIRFINQLGLP